LSYFTRSSREKASQDICSEGKNGKPFHLTLRSGIWYQTDETTKEIIPESQRILHMVGVKSCWGGAYKKHFQKEKEKILMMNEKKCENKEQ
jgi:hypothetical protein